MPWPEMWPSMYSMYALVRDALNVQYVCLGLRCGPQSTSLSATGRTRLGEMLIDLSVCFQQGVLPLCHCSGLHVRSELDLLLLRSPAISLGFTILGEIFAYVTVLKKKKKKNPNH